MKIAINGKAYSAAIEDSDVPQQENWPKPTIRFCGNGFQAIYEVTRDRAWLIITHLEDVASCFTDAENQEDRYAIKRAVRSLHTQVARQPGPWTAQVASPPDSGVQSAP